MEGKYKYDPIKKEFKASDKKSSIYSIRIGTSNALLYFINYRKYEVTAPQAVSYNYDSNKVTLTFTNKGSSYTCVLKNLSTPQAVSITTGGI